MVTPISLDEDNSIEVKFVVFCIAFLLDLLILPNSFIFYVVFYLSQKMVLIHIYLMCFLYSVFFEFI